MGEREPLPSCVCGDPASRHEPLGVGPCIWNPDCLCTSYRPARGKTRPHYGAKRERTLAVTWGPWGGIWWTGNRKVIWRLCLGWVALTYIPAEMTQILDAWLKRDGF